MGPGSWGYSLGPLASTPPEPVPAATDHPHVPCAPHRPASLGRPMHVEKLNLATGKARVAEARLDGRRSARGHPRLRLRAVAPVTRPLTSRALGSALGPWVRAHSDGSSGTRTWRPSRTCSQAGRMRLAGRQWPHEPPPDLRPAVPSWA